MATTSVPLITQVDAGATFDVLGVEGGLVKLFNGNTLPIPYSAITNKPPLGPLAGLSIPNNLALFLRGDGQFASLPSSGGLGGGIANPMSAAGDLIIGGVSGTPIRLPKGTGGITVLTTDSNTGVVSWKPPTTTTNTGGTTDLTAVYDAIAFATVVAVDASARVTILNLKA